MKKFKVISYVFLLLSIFISGCVTQTCEIQFDDQNEPYKKYTTQPAPSISAIQQTIVAAIIVPLGFSVDSVFMEKNNTNIPLNDQVIPLHKNLLQNEAMNRNLFNPLTQTCFFFKTNNPITVTAGDFAEYGILIDPDTTSEIIVGTFESDLNDGTPLTFFTHVNGVTSTFHGTSSLYESFEYPPGDSIGAHGWIANTGGATNRIVVTTPGLSYFNFIFSGIGNTATLSTTGQDAYKHLGTIYNEGNSNAVYVSFMVNVTAAQRPGDYFLAFLPSTSSSFYSGRVHARLNNGMLEFGLTKASPNDTNSMVWVSGYSLNTNYLMVLKYRFLPGLANDQVSLHILSSHISSVEPGPAIPPMPFPTSGDANDIGRIALRQGTASRAPNVIVDGVCVTSSWDIAFPTFISLNLTAAIEGYYNSNTNQLIANDVIDLTLRQTISPYNIVDVSFPTLQAQTLTAQGNFINAPDGIYYFALKHRNSIETWSAGGINFNIGVPVNYDLTSSLSQAFGNNMIHVDNSPLRFAIYSGDVNQDGIVDAGDISLIDNAAFNFITGYVTEDVTGDEIVDASDLSITDNNAFNFVIKITP